jgi:hypothetical protein
MLHRKHTEEGCDGKIDEKRHLCFVDLPQPTDCTPDGSCGGRCYCPGTSSDNLLTRSASPDSNSLPPDSILATESAGVTGVLCDFHLLDLFSERGTVTGTVFSSNADLLGAFAHFGCWDGEGNLVSWGEGTNFYIYGGENETKSRMKLALGVTI